MYTIMEEDNLKDVFGCYEDFEAKIKGIVLEGIVPEEVLFQYKVLFRRWDLIKDSDVEKYKNEKIQVPEFDKLTKKIRWRPIEKTIQYLFDLNVGYYNKAYEKNDSSNDEIGYYTDLVMEPEQKSVIDEFFCGVFPILNVVKYDVQKRASKMLKENPYHLVFDEVGTGKTVVALYCIQNVLNEKKADAKVLIMCPNNKKKEWQKDLQRQLGIYAHMTGNSAEKGEIYNDEIKSIYFKEGEPCVFIKRQKKEGNIDSDLHRWNKRTNDVWDIIIIDEGHLCFNNYDEFKAKKVIILTATPIVIQSGSTEIKSERTIQDYIHLAEWITRENITGITGNNNIVNLFQTENCFTQLFREDLNINPPKRKIIFEKTKRFEGREKYLDILRNSVGGMAKLIYEQDDEFLRYGINKRFKDEIEKDYIVPDVDLEGKNYKYDTLSKIIQKNKEKSYIIFFNFRWTAEMIYEHLLNDPSLKEDNTIIALKLGKSKYEVWPQDVGVNSENIFDYLLGKTDRNYRVLFVTTGATGGTGLNLGKFDGIVNYEMPFTSIELEQRFGRVDRMDTHDGKDRDMIFILNEDFNPMLRYSLIKINKTCTYMPIRNTILFCSEVIEQIIKDLKMTYEVNKLTEEEREYEKMKQSVTKKAEKKSISNIEKYVIRGKAIDCLEEEVEDATEEYKCLLDFMKSNDKLIKKVNLKRNNLTDLKADIQGWMEVIGLEDCSEGCWKDQGESFIYVEEDNDENTDWDGEREFDCEKSRIKIGNMLVCDKKIDVVSEGDEEDLIKNMIEKIENVSSQSQIATGIFYINENRYNRQSVKEYREKHVSL